MGEFLLELPIVVPDSLLELNQLFEVDAFIQEGDVEEAIPHPEELSILSFFNNFAV